MSKGFCSNCRTKYSLFNPENGCSNCAFSFCSKCIDYKALLPRLADKPVSVCYSCYQKLNDQKIKHFPQNETTSASANWWGDGLPPPSFRQTVGTTKPSNQTKTNPENSTKVPSKPDTDLASFEKRLAVLKENEKPSAILTVEEIENRLAALRECDVEVIRNPRSWFDLSNTQPTGNDPLELIRNTKAQVAIDQEYDPDNVIQRRYNELKDQNDSDVRMSTVSGATEFSEATKEELEQMNKLMNEAEKCVADNNEKLKKDSELQKELSNVMASVRQKSLDLESTNNRVQNEISNFWTKQINKQLTEGNSDEEVDDEMVKKIVAEAEATPDEPLQRETPSPQKKKNFLSKLFKK